MKPMITFLLALEHISIKIDLMTSEDTDKSVNSLNSYILQIYRATPPPNLWKQQQETKL